jgi:hypothetical protein
MASFNFYLQEFVDDLAMEGTSVSDPDDLDDRIGLRAADRA